MHFPSHSFADADRRVATPLTLCAKQIACLSVTQHGAMENTNRIIASVRPSLTLALLIKTVAPSIHNSIKIGDAKFRLTET